MLGCDRSGIEILDERAESEHLFVEAVIYGPRTWERRGATIALNFFHPDGRIVDRAVDRVASARNTSLRTGCFCNPRHREIAFTIARGNPRWRRVGGGHDARGLHQSDRPTFRRRGPGLAQDRCELRRPCRFKAFAREYIDLTAVANDLPARTAC